MNFLISLRRFRQRTLHPSLRSKILLYLLLIHLLFGVVAFIVLLQNKLWLFAIEAIFAVSILLGVKLVRSFFVPLDMIRTGTQFIQESDFTSRIREVGQPEMDQLIGVYNRMVDNLREERVRQQEQHYFLDKILKASPSAVITFDFDQRVAMVNPSAEKIFQLAGLDMAGRKLSEIGVPLADDLEHLHSGESKVIPLQGRRRLKCYKSQFLDQGFSRDFIIIDELTEELRQSEKSAYEKLIRMMSHEVNNSVAAVNSLLQSCLNYREQLAREDRSDFETALNVVISRTDHLNSFMKGFADVVRLQAARREPCNIADVVGNVCHLMKAETEKRDIRLRIDLQQQLPPVSMDRHQMEQVFINILKNAMEAIDAEGTINVRTEKKGPRGSVVIEDTGCGISPEVKANLFSPFFTTKENGQGIGLTVIQEILTRHDFEFALEGKPGGPTQFTIYF
ncbi:MAG TPA: ATP-binding protein [Acidobacteriota bacterium]|jgi:nitrogen fixation/metabolism regulation signal transduction histidine kinase